MELAVAHFLFLRHADTVGLWAPGRECVCVGAAQIVHQEGLARRPPGEETWTLCSQAKIRLIYLL